MKELQSGHSDVEMLTATAIPERSLFQAEKAFAIQPLLRFPGAKAFWGVLIRGEGRSMKPKRQDSWWLNSEWPWPRPANRTPGLLSLPARLRVQVWCLTSRAGVLVLLTEAAYLLQSGFLGMLPECQVWGSHLQCTIPPVKLWLVSGSACGRTCINLRK